jgi:hypothetical protein
MKSTVLKFIISLIVFIAVSCGPEVPTSPETRPEDVPALRIPLIHYHGDFGQIHLQVKAEDDEPLSELDVFSRVYRPDLDTVWFTAHLNDDGEDGDQIPGDRHFSITVDSAVSDTLGGELLAWFWAVDADGNISDTLSAYWSLSANQPPHILDIWSPDTVMRPEPGETDTFTVMVEATDPDGLKDIAAVFFDVRDADDTTQWNSNPLFVLNDAGIGADRVQGDGIYSTSLTISSENRLTDNIFRYYAIDNAGNQSPYAFDTITVYQNYIPVIESFFISSPTEIVRPSAGETGDSLLFYIHARDGNSLDELTAVRLLRRNSDGTLFEQTYPEGYDDGLHDDFSANDGWFTIKSGFTSDDDPGDYFYRALVKDAYGNRVLSADSIEVTLVEE